MLGCNAVETPLLVSNWVPLVALKTGVPEEGQVIVAESVRLPVSCGARVPEYAPV